jgi:hypothetical protein
VRWDRWNSGLFRVDDRATDGAGAGEELLQFVAFAPADRALQCRQVLVEPLQNLEDRFPIIQGDAAPQRKPAAAWRQAAPYPQPFGLPILVY